MKSFGYILSGLPETENGKCQGRMLNGEFVSILILIVLDLVVQFVAESRFANCEFANLFLALTNCNFLDFKSRTSFSSISIKSRQN